ncbi:molybdenum transport system permease protein ModB [bacterium BMS3Abin06]|nr:molybdenum transport system permease protein ModB [bacterium BMS3Abin06]HDZ03054.1 ABC transporter permease subunit [Nitrospirota bacterium]
MKQVGQRVEEAAFLTTGNWSKVMYRIIIPLTKHSLIAGFFIVFILSIGEIGTTLLVIPPGRETVPIKIYNLMHYGADQMVAALCLILIAIILAFSGLFLIVHKSLNKQSA